MTKDLNGKVVIVTGAAGAIGSAVCREFVKYGVKLVMADIRENELKELENSLVQDCDVVAIPVDVRKQDSVKALVAKTVERFGEVNVMVNAAGVMKNIASRAELQDFNDDIWNDVIATDMTGTFYCVKAAASEMVKQGKGGSIINVGSAKGILPSKLQCAFAAAKAGVFNFTKATGMEMAPDGIRINAIAAGDVINDEVAALDEESIALMKSHVPAGVLGTPEDFAGICCFLATDAAKYINAAIIPVDGAWTSGYSRDF